MLWCIYQWWRFAGWSAMMLARNSGIGPEDSALYRLYIARRLSDHAFDQRNKILNRALNNLARGKADFWPMRKGTY